MAASGGSPAAPPETLLEATNHSTSGGWGLKEGRGLKEGVELKEGRCLKGVDFK